MARIFQNDHLQQQFEIDGYVVMPWFSAAEVAALQNIYRKKFPEAPEGFYSTSFSKNESAKAEAMKAVDEIFEKETKKVLAPFRKLGSCFLNKTHGVKSEMPIHQDWTVVEEPEFDSVTIWIPLVDVNEKNGAMQVVEGSHRFSSELRSPSLPNPFQNVQQLVRQDLKTIPMKAGEALIFSQALLHASPANLSNADRPVVTYGFIPQEAQLLFYHKNGKDIVEKLQVRDDFFQKYNTNIGTRPTAGEPVAEIPFKVTYITAEEYQKQKLKHRKNKQRMFKMIPFFKDQQKQEFFEREGYIVFPLLNEAEVHELKQFYESLQIKDEMGFGFHVSMDQKDKEMCRRVREKVWSILMPKMEEHLKDFKPFVSSFVVKESNPKGVVPAHQDWSFVDREEDGYCSVTCWVALVDMNLDNGQMGVIRGSHKFMQNIRPSPSPQAPVPLSEHMFGIFPYFKTLDMKPGEVLMFDNRTIHASPPNTTDSVRLAVGIGITQKDAQLVHYYLKPDGTNSTCVKYNVDHDFFLKYENSTLAKMFDKREFIEGYEAVAEVPYHCPKLSSEELIAIIKAAGNEFNVPLIEKLAKLFDYNIDGTPKKKEEPTAYGNGHFEIEEEKVLEPVSDERSFFETYTPINILKEIKYRITGKA